MRESTNSSAYCKSLEGMGSLVFDQRVMNIVMALMINGNVLYIKLHVFLFVDPVDLCHEQ